jgi:hypothetical protein
MKKFLLLWIAGLFLAQISVAQISGTKSIPGDYAGVAAAIAAINASGVGPGGVTFNVNAGLIETFATPIAGLITATGTAANPIIFQKSGTGSNPLITGGLITSASSTDGIIVISGGDYITFDKIDLQENPGNSGTNLHEWGYALVKASATDGAQNNVIKNCTITLNKANLVSVAIYGGNHLATSTTALAVTAMSGTNSNNKIFSNTISNTYIGISMTGFADAAVPPVYFDQNNEIGKDGGNGLSNFGGAGSTIYGIYAGYQNGLKVSNNTISGPVTYTGSGSCYMIYTTNGNYSNLDIYGNTISVQFAATTGSFYAIYSGMGHSGTGNTVNVYNNTITNCTHSGSTSGSMFLLYHIATCFTLNIYGNQITNNTLGSATVTATGSFAGMYTFGASTISGSTENVYNNTITGNQRIQSAAGAGTTWYMYSSASRLTTNIYNNTISNNTPAATGITYCIYNTSGPTVKNIYGNTISNILNARGTLYGIYQTTGTAINIYKNKIQNLNAINVANTVYGVYISSGTTANVYNNMISELKTPASTNNPAIYGLYISTPTSCNAWYNTIYLNAASTGATFGAAGIYGSTAPSIELRNNIVVNNSTPGATGRVVAYQRSANSLATFSMASNNNDFWAGTPGASNLIFYDATNSIQTLADYKTLMSPREAGSVTENPPFVNVATSPYDLHLQTTIPTQCESGGSVIATPVSITDDYDANPRFPNAGYPNNPLSPATAPDLGADEFAGLLLDITPPNVVFTPFLNTASTLARTLTTTITDATGVPISGLGLPVLRWKINSGAWNSVTATSGGGSQYSFTFGAGALLNDVVSYYIVSQDIVSPPNVGSTPLAGAGGFSVNPPACTTPPTTPYTYTIVSSLSGVYPVGTGQVYPTITAAVADLNFKEVVGPVTFELWDATYSTSETFPLIIGPYAGMSATNTVKFKPKAGVTSTVTGSTTSGIIALSGVNYLTLDGSNSGGTDKNLTWENTNTAANTYVIGVFNYNGAGASNCTIKNCMIKASSQVTNTTYAIILNAAGGGYNNIVIDNNTIFSARYGMQFAGVSTAVATNGQITNNIIGSTIDATAIQYRGILLSYANNTLISGNEIMGAPAGNTNFYQAGVYIMSGVTNSKIRKNRIHDFYYTGTSGYANYGIYYGAESTTPTEISNNIIYAIKSDGDPGNQNYNPAGIYLFTGGNCQIYHNTINMSGATLSSTYLSFSSCISIANGIPNLDIQDNILKNSMTPVSGTGNKTYAIYNAGANTSFIPVNYNNYFVDGINPNIGYQGGDQATLVAWKAATGQDASSVNLNPAFVSATDFHPTNAAMGHLGIYLPSVTTDFTGVSRTNPPDQGVYEFSVDPVVTTIPAALVTTNSATLNGSTNPGGFTVNTFFDYGTTTAYGSTLAGSPSSATGSIVTTFSGAVSSLLPGTTYHFRARVVTTGGLIAYGNDFTYTTLVTPPSVVTTAANAITVNTATLNGTVNANGSSTLAQFEYGLTVSYGTLVTAVQSPVTGSSVTPINIGVTGLQPNTLYHFRAVGTNLGGTVNGADLTFTTLAEPPVVVTNVATNIQPASAQLNGTVTARNSATTVTFEYGLTTSYGSNITATPATVNGNTATPVSANISGLTANTTYHFRCVGVNAAGTTNGADQSFLTGCPVPSPAGNITGPVNVCQGGTGYVYTVPVILNASAYNWTVPTGASITAGGNTNSITVSYSGTAVSGNITVYGSSLCGSGVSSSLAVTVNSLPVPTITGPASVCVNVPGTIYTTEAAMTGYVWTVSSGGTITAGTGTNAITVTWTTAGAKTVTVNYATASGCTAANATSYAVTVNALPVPTITGSATACQNSSSVYTTQTGMTGYTWTVSAGGTITSGTGTNAITVLWATTGVKVVTANYTNVTGCTAVTPGTFNVSVNAAAAPTIASNNDPCTGSTGNMYYTESGMSNYVWTVSAGGAIVSGQGTSAVNVTWTGVGAQTVTVNYSNSAGCPAASPAVYNLFVNPMPSAAGAITGTSSLCAGTNGVAYSCGSIMNATSYTWTLPAGAVIATGAGTTNITVNFGSAAISGNITVSGTNSCGNGTSSPAFAVTVSPLPAPAGTITGSASVCAGSTGVAYSVPAISNATSYVWTVPAGATITSGATTRNIVVSFGPTAGSGSITVKGTNSCGSGTVSPSLNVTINAIPATPVITATGSLLTSSASTGNQWYFEGTAIVGATGQTYTVTNNTGFYWCVVTMNGCSSPISNKVWMVVTGVGELSASQINVYPVPNDGRFTVSITAPSSETFSIRVFDQVGRKIFEISDLQVNGAIEKQIDLRPVSGGVYSVVIMNREGKVVKKVLVN